jgi:cytochrome b561
MAPSSTDRYDITSQVFHWITAVAVLAAFILGPGGFGRMLHDGIDPGTRTDILWHESLGLLVFGLTLLRLLWVALRPAAPQHAMAGWMQLASKGAHLLLWAMLLALPVTALLTLASEGAPLTLLGGVRVEALGMMANARLAGIAGLADWGDVHSFMGDAIIWLAGLHAVAAIYHHVRLKDGVLASMVPWLKSR